MPSVVFWNTSDLPLMVDTWITGSNRLECLKIHPYEKRVLESSTGEWYLNTILDEEDRKLWIAKGLGKYTTLGKVRLMPCAQGDRAWMESDIFQCVYYATESFKFSIIIDGR